MPERTLEPRSAHAMTPLCRPTFGLIMLAPYLTAVLALSRLDQAGRAGRRQQCWLTARLAARCKWPCYQTRWSRVRAGSLGLWTVYGGRRRAGSRAHLHHLRSVRGICILHLAFAIWHGTESHGYVSITKQLETTTTATRTTAKPSTIGR